MKAPKFSITIPNKLNHGYSNTVVLHALNSSANSLLHLSSFKGRVLNSPCSLICLGFAQLRSNFLYRTSGPLSVFHVHSSLFSGDSTTTNTGPLLLLHFTHLPAPHTRLSSLRAQTCPVHLWLLSPAQYLTQKRCSQC